MMNSYMPVRLFTGIDCVEKNKKEFTKLGNICLIVCGKNSATACGALQDACDALDSLEIPYTVFNEIGPNPALIDCMRAAEKLQKAVNTLKKLARPEEDTRIEPFILGIGGGSPLDAAKCIAVLGANPGMTISELYSLKWPQKPYPSAVIGTTAGTGSEVTKVSVITTPDGRKKSFHHESIFPVIAFGDPRYTMSMSYEQTASTAIDAFAHCMESYFSRAANELSQTYAIRGIHLLLPMLEKMKDREAEISLYEREQIYNASIYGGLAINVTGTCMPHTMGYLMTEQHGLPHGYACAVFLKAFLLHNQRCVPTLTGEFLRAIGNVKKEDLLDLFDDLLSDCIEKIEVTDEEITREHGRWSNNGSIAKTWGEVTPEMCDEILRQL